MLPLTTDRLVLRQPQTSDVAALRVYHARNRERFARWDPVPGDDPAVHAEWVSARCAEARDGMPATLLAFATEADDIAGIVSLTSFGVAPPSALLSYSVDGMLEGKGYASEAVAAVVAYAFAALRLERLSAMYEPANVRSARLLARLGFTVAAVTPVVPGMERFMRAHVLAIRDAAGAAGTEPRT